MNNLTNRSCFEEFDVLDYFVGEIASNPLHCDSFSPMRIPVRNRYWIGGTPVFVNPSIGDCQIQPPSVGVVTKISQLHGEHLSLTQPWVANWRMGTFALNFLRHQPYYIAVLGSEVMDPRAIKEVWKYTFHPYTDSMLQKRTTNSQTRQTEHVTKQTTRYCSRNC